MMRQPQGGTLIFSYICRLGSFFFFFGGGGGGVQILNFNIFGGFQKNEYFLDMKIMWIFLWRHHKI